MIRFLKNLFQLTKLDWVINLSETDEDYVSQNFQKNLIELKINVGAKACFNQSNYERFWMLLKLTYTLLRKEANYPIFAKTYLKWL